MSWRRSGPPQAAGVLDTDAPGGGHTSGMDAAAALPAVGAEVGKPALPALGARGAVATHASLAPLPPLDVAAVFEQHLAFVWRSARRLGVQPAYLDDVVQEVFVVVHRRAAGFEGRSALRTWLFGITRRVVRDHFRGQRRKPAELVGQPVAVDTSVPDAEAQLGAREAQALLHALLATLDDDKREVFVLSELEQMSMPEIAAALELNVNTAYARLRAARAAFEQALKRHNARQRALPGAGS
jgi:RNA polymerase sigma-70 factor (ECF subfamily)